MNSLKLKYILQLRLICFRDLNMYISRCLPHRDVYTKHLTVTDRAITRRYRVALRIAGACSRRRRRGRGGPIHVDVEKVESWIVINRPLSKVEDPAPVDQRQIKCIRRRRWGGLTVPTDVGRTCDLFIPPRRFFLGFANENQ